MALISRRTVLGAGLAAVGAALAPCAGAAAARTGFMFVHITDTYIQPELGATEGVHKAFQAVRSLPRKPAFGLIGGDLVMDAALVPHSRADLVYDLWRQEAASLSMPLHYAIGNHDLYGLKVDGKPALDDPDYGKTLWKKRVGVDQTYATFDHDGWRFVTLDSVGITPGYIWEGALHDTEMQWLDQLLRDTPQTMPMVFLTHFPIFTAVTQYTQGTTAQPTSGDLIKNGKLFREMTQRHNVKILCTVSGAFRVVIGSEALAQAA